MSLVSCEPILPTSVAMRLLVFTVTVICVRWFLRLLWSLVGGMEIGLLKLLQKSFSLKFTHFSWINTMAFFNLGLTFRVLKIGSLIIFASVVIAFIGGVNFSNSLLHHFYWLSRALVFKAPVISKVTLC